MSKRFVRTGGFTTGDDGASNTQGVATDGTNIWVSEGNEIYKYTYAGVYITKHDCTPDGTNNHLGGLTIVGDALYVTTSAYPSTPYNMYVKEYDKNTLAYVDEYFINANYIGEDIEFKDNRFWFLVDNEPYRMITTDASFGDYQEISFPSIGVAFSGNNNGWNGMVWVGDTLYANPHGGTYPDKVFQFSWNGTGFSYIGPLLRPVPREWNGQGMDYNAATGEFLFAGRHVDDSDDSVTFATLEDVDPVLTSTDYDAYKNSSVVRTASLAFSGNVGGGNEKIVTDTLVIDSPDFAQILFDNNRQHPDKFKSLSLERGFTAIRDQTTPTDLLIQLSLKITGNVITIQGRLFNPSASTITLQGTTIKFRYMPYENTI